jgi:hypothetical protein
MFSVTKDTEVSPWSCRPHDKKAAPFGGVHSTWFEKLKARVPTTK